MRMPRSRPQPRSRLTSCCPALGTPIAAVTRRAGGQYDAGGDPALAFDSHGRVFYAGLVFNRTSAPNTVAVSAGAFDGSGARSSGPPTFINQTGSPPGTF